MPTSESSPDEWGQQFHQCRHHKIAFTEDLHRLLAHLLEGEEIDAQLEFRTKEVDSFVEKIRRKNEKYDDPLREVTDLCGLRVVCYYQEDVRRVNDLVEREFEVDWGNSVRYRPDTDPERFGYRSDQYIVSLSPERQNLPEWGKFDGDVAEIQVRTIMQHAWAAVDHKIRYKASDLPSSVRRRLSRLSALLETADDQFSAVREESLDVGASYRRSIDAQDFNVSIDALSLREFLQATDAATSWAERAVGLGYAVDPTWVEAGGIASVFADQEFDDLLKALHRSERTTLKSLKELLDEAETWGPPVLEAIKKGSEERGFRPYAVPDDILTFLVLYDGGIIAAVKEFDNAYRQELAASLRDAIRSKS